MKLMLAIFLDKIYSVSQSMFDIMALGHSGLLIFWKPFYYEDRRHFLLNETSNGKGNQTSHTVRLDTKRGQYVISSLAETT